MLSKRLVIRVAGLLLGSVTLAALVPLQEMVEPTQEHSLILKEIGAYEGTIEFWTPGQDEPMASPCEEVISGVGALWTASRFEMDYMGQPFEGVATLGFDPAKGKFVGTWIDSMSTTLTVQEGIWDADQNAIVMEYEMIEGAKSIAMRSVHTQTDTGYTVEFFRLDDGEAKISMRMTMKRKLAIEANAPK